MYKNNSFKRTRNSRPSRGYSSQRPKGRQPKKDYINPSKFVKPAKPVAQTVYSSTNNFADFDLNQIVAQNIFNMGFKSPSAIQDQAIPVGLKGQDIVGIANTGTGKTAAFAIPMLNKLINVKDSKAIIMAPTRELAEQIEEQCKLIGKGSGLYSALLIGGKAMGPQLGDLRVNPRVVIGTPGRIKDHIERGSLNLNQFNITVLDEVDRMLDMGFVNDITFILERTNKNRQSYYFSATLNERVRQIIESFSNNPVNIQVKSGDTSANVEQNVVMHQTDNKLDKLHDILIADKTVKTIIFDDTHRTVDRLHKELHERGFSVESIHGGKSQSQRQRVLDKFKKSEINVLVATDVAARGLDVSDISHVINYSLPQTYDDYVHRIGRTGRAGKIGYALTFIQK
jgi:superfamily II DNA/RNA helicase